MNFNTMYEIMAHHYINKKKVTPSKDLSNGKKLLILATGKSANEYWNDTKIQERYGDYDLLVMNRSIYKMEKEIFEKKPRYFAICDPIYWGKGNGKVKDELIKDTYESTKRVLEKINWKCFLVTSIHENFDFRNENITMIRLNQTEYDVEKESCFHLYKKNYCSPKLLNVGQISIYFGITFGYQEIGIVGMDFDFFKNLFCDGQGSIGLFAEHQYDHVDGTIVEARFTKENYGTLKESVMAKYLLNITDTFATYGKLQQYAVKENCRIINYSKNSMIDCYEKCDLRE